MQLLKSIKPLSINTDTDELLLKSDEARYIKNYRISFNQNASLPTATGDAPSGSNFGVLTPLPSNRKLLGRSVLTLPAGNNKCCGAFESIDTGELYYMNYNSNGIHGLYRITGETLQWEIVGIDKEFNFSLDPKYHIPAHTITLKVLYYTDKEGVRRIKEKYLKYTDANNWQRWINVEACVGSETFNDSKFPYWKTHQPHFDRAEYFEWATRPPMYCPTVKPLPLNEDDKGKNNTLLNKSKQFAYRFIYTDGRMTTVSPWSLPFYLTKSSCNINSVNLPRCLELTLYAGSAMVEKIEILVKECNSDWMLYDTIYRFSSCDDNAPDKIGLEYWKRVNPWENFSYDPTFNTIKYKYCGDKGVKLFNQEDANRFETDLPIKSVALTSAGDTEILVNNEYDYPNLPCETMEKLNISVKSDETKEQCPLVYRKLTLYSYIGRDARENQPIWFYGDDAQKRFGGVVIKPPTPFGGEWTIDVLKDDPKVFGSDFGDKEGFIMYLAGTPFYAVGKQYMVDPDGVTMTLIGALDFSKQDQNDLFREHINKGGFFIQKYEFGAIPAGKYIARLARHSASDSGEYQQSSTWVMGIANSKLRNGSQITNGALVTYSKEIEIDCCNDDVDVWGNSKDLFYVFCPYQYDGDGGALANRRWRFIEGYVYEDDKDKVGVELLTYNSSHGFGEFMRDGHFTDHNGFYFGYSARGDAKKSVIEFRGKLNCKNDGSILFSNRDLPAKDRGYYPNENIFVKLKNNDKFGECNRVLVRGKIINCDTGVGISGIAVTITRGGSAFTKDDGTFELIVHNSFEVNRVDRIYFNASGECVLTSCDCQCDEIVNYNDNTTPCIGCIERVYGQVILRKYKMTNKSLASLKGGGRYNGGITAFDLAGRGTYVQPVNYFDVPTFLETGKFLPSKAAWALNGKLNLPREFKYLTFYITKNLNSSKYLQWVGDKIEFINHNGDIVASPSSAVRARITIQSLNDYNNENTFSSTTKYQFVEGDKVRIYDNGDNKLFVPAQTNGFLDYEILGTNWSEATPPSSTAQTSATAPVTDGKSIIIPYDNRLDELKDKCGFWIELIRPSESNQTEEFCEICGVYPIIDGEIAIFKGVDANNTPIYDFPTTGSLEAFDTYYQTRFFKIKNCGGKMFTHPFESSSITDYWGENCSSCGRKNVRNENAQQRWYIDDSIRSDAFVNEGGYNGLGTFRDSNRKQFKGQDAGGVVAAKAIGTLIIFICERDWFTTDYNLNIVRATKDGLVVANLDNTLGDPHRKIGSNYGLDLEDKSAIEFDNGLIVWADKKNSAVVICNYETAQDISEVDNKSYFQEKFKFVTAYNQSLSKDDYLENLIDIITGIDPQTKDFHITFRPRRGMTRDLNSFVNDEREIKIEHQETFVFNLDQKKWVRFTGYAPEFYGKLRYARGVQMVTFALGIPYTHSHIAGGTFNTFFGIKTQRVIRGVFNDLPSKEKVFMSMAIESNGQKHFVDMMKTDDKNSFSYIPISYWKKKQHIYYSETLRNMNTYPPADRLQAYRVMLIDGKAIFGLFVDFQLVGDLQDLDGYNELNNIIIRIAGSEQSQK